MKSSMFGKIERHNEQVHVIAVPNSIDVKILLWGPSGVPRNLYKRVLDSLHTKIL